MGAIAFQKDLGAVHSCAHALGTVCDLHHGLANALMIDTVLRLNVAAAPAKFAELAHVGRRERRRAPASSPGCAQLKQTIGIAPSLRRAPASSANRSRAWSRSPTADICHQTNPRPCTARRLRAPLRGGDVTDAARAGRIKIGISALLLPRRRRRGRLHRQDAALRRAVDRALGDVERRARADDPEPGRRHARRATCASTDYAEWLDGLVLQGGSDVCARQLRRAAAGPRSGTATACATTTRSSCFDAFVGARQAGARHLPRPAADERRPRRHALQDIATQRPEALVHRDADDLRPQRPPRSSSCQGTRLARALRRRRARRSINSVHHQAVKELGRGFVVEARCPSDGIVEAIRWPGRARTWPPCSGIPNSIGQRRRHARRSTRPRRLPRRGARRQAPR